MMLGGQQWAVTDAPGDTDGCARLRVKVTIPQPFPVLGGGLVSFLDRVPGPNGPKCGLRALSTWLCSCGARSSMLLPAQSKPSRGCPLLSCLPVYDSFRYRRAGYIRQEKLGI